MLMSVEHERLVRMLKESISLMCKSSLNYDLELNVEGLLGITLDKKDVVLVNINESFQTAKALKPPSPERPSPAQKRSQEVIEIKEESAGSPPSCAKKKRHRRRSRDSTDGQQMEQFSVGFRPEQSGIDPSSQSHADSSMDSVQIAGAIDTQSSVLSSGAANVKDDQSGELDFSDIVIKQELGDENATTDQVEDFSFTGESFDGTQHSLTDPGYHQASDVQQMAASYNPSASTSAEEGSLARAENTVWSSGRFQGRFPFNPQTGKDKIFPCRYCSETFSSSTARYEHESLLHLGKGFGCSFCGKVFSSNWKLQRHKRNVHQKTLSNRDIA